jgi:hypothetical protein
MKAITTDISSSSWLQDLRGIEYMLSDEYTPCVLDYTPIIVTDMGIKDDLRLFCLDIPANLTKFYGLHDGYHVVAYMRLDRDQDGTIWKSWLINMIYMSPRFRGRQLATLLYDAALIADKLFLANGPGHTKFSKARWATFVRTNRYKIWAADFKSPSTIAMVEYDEDTGQIDCDLPLYQKNCSQHDVRLCAVAW